MKDQVFRLYHVYHNDGAPEERLVARFMIHQGQFHILEDHDHLLKESLVEGPYDSNHERLINHLANSGYYRLVNENEVNEGHHDDILPDLDIGPVEPDAEYLLSTDAHEAPERVEMYGQNVIMGGRKLTEEETNELMARVRSGEYSLTAI